MLRFRWKLSTRPTKVNFAVRQILLSAIILEFGWMALLLWVVLKPFERRRIMFRSKDTKLWILAAVVVIVRWGAGTLESAVTSAGTGDTTVSWDSPPDSGCSVGNLAPSASANAKLAIAGPTSVRVSWDRNRIDPDIGHYEVYRSTASGFPTIIANRIAATADTAILDAGLSSGQTYYYRIVTVDLDGNTSLASPELNTGGPLAVGARGPLPDRFALDKIYPDPFNPSTTISCQLPQAAHVTLKVYTVLGQEVATLVDDMQYPGFKSVQWNGEHVASGVCFYRIVVTSGGQRIIQVRNMLITKGAPESDLDISYFLHFKL
jgi:hypothetical protein